MTRTLSQKALEKAAGEIHLATGEKMEWARPIARSAIAAYLDEVEREAPASAPTPTGWRLVPIEPTKRMLIDGVCALAHFQVIGSRIGFSNIGDTYRAMLAAAPEPPASEPKPMIYLLDELNGIVIGGKKHGWIVWLNRNENWQTVKKARVRDPMENVPDIFKPLPATPKGRESE